DQLACHAHLTYIETTDAFHAYCIAAAQCLRCRIPVEFLPAPLIETYLYDPAAAFRVAERKIDQPVVNIHPVAPAGRAPAITFATGRFAPLGCAAITTTHILE